MNETGDMMRRRHERYMALSNHFADVQSSIAKQHGVEWKLRLRQHKQVTLAEADWLFFGNLSLVFVKLTAEMISGTRQEARD